MTLCFFLLAIISWIRKSYYFGLISNIRIFEILNFRKFETRKLYKEIWKTKITKLFIIVFFIALIFLIFVINMKIHRILKFSNFRNWIINDKIIKISWFYKLEIFIRNPKVSNLKNDYNFFSFWKFIEFPKLLNFQNYQIFKSVSNWQISNFWIFEFSNFRNEKIIKRHLKKSKITNLIFYCLLFY